MTTFLLPRRVSIPVSVGGVVIGGEAPIVVQSMTHTDRADIEGTARQSSAIVELALKHAKPVRIGVNWGSLDQELLTRLMDENAASATPKDARAVLHEAIVQSGLLSAERAEELGMKPEQIIISAKVSAVQDLVSVYTMLAKRCRYALHLGLTEAGMGSKGIVASTAAMGILLQQGIGDTIRVSLTPEPGGDRTQEVRVAQEILQDRKSTRLNSSHVS